MQAFAAIGDAGIRRSLMTLTEGVARLSQRESKPKKRA
jgi:hypothetical protein